MAAFCTCCGSAITLKSVTCAACGAPSHGMTFKMDRSGLPALELKEVIEVAPPSETAVRNRMHNACCAA